MKKPTTLSLRVAAEIRAELARQQIDARDLAAALDLSAATIYGRINGQHPFNVSELAAAGRMFGISASEIVRRAES